MKSTVKMPSNGFWKKRIESLGSVFVNFELFCGNSKPVERPESRVEQEFAAKRRDPPTRYGTPA